MHIVARMLTGKRLRTVAQGLENIPTQGPVIVAARHYHHLFDGLAFFAVMERRFHFVVTLDWVHTRRGKLIMSTLNRLARWPMVLRENSLVNSPKRKESLFDSGAAQRYRLAALRQAVKLLSEGRVLVIFPEGYPNIDPVYTPKISADEFLPFKAGFAAIAESAGRVMKKDIPIIPAGIRYQTGTCWVANLCFGKPVYRRDFPSRQSLVDHVAEAVKQLSGFETKRRQ